MTITTNALRIKPQFSVVAHSNDHIELRSGVWNATCYTVKDDSKKGYLLSIIKGLNGEATPSELAKRLNIPRTEVETLIDHLQQLGVIETSATNVFDLYLNTTSPLLANPYEKVSQKFPIVLFGDDELCQPLYKLLCDTFSKDKLAIDLKYEFLNILKSSNDDWLFDGLLHQEMIDRFESLKKHLILFVQKTPDPHISSKWNKIAHALQIPWIHAVVDGPFLFVGPTFYQDGPCYDCFETRMMMNLREYASYQKYKEALIENKIIHHEKFSVDPVLTNLLISHLAMEAINFVLTGYNFTKRKLFAIYLPTMEITYNEVLRHANCPTCASNAIRDGHQLYFDIHTLLKNDEN